MAFRVGDRVEVTEEESEGCYLAMILELTADGQALVRRMAEDGTALPPESVAFARLKPLPEASQEEEADADGSTSRTPKRKRVDPQGSLPTNIIPNQQPPCLPFSKTNPLWATIESSEPFKRMRVQPHFQGMAGHNKSWRESMGIAIASKLLQLDAEVSQFKFADPIAKFQETLGVLNTLSDNGFSVEAFKAHVQRLMFIKENAQLCDPNDLFANIGRLRNEIAMYEHQISELTRKKDQDLAEVANLEQLLNSHQNA